MTVIVEQITVFLTYSKSPLLVVLIDVFDELIQLFILSRLLSVLNHSSHVTLLSDSVEVFSQKFRTAIKCKITYVGL